jgi:hypothetical protein
VTRLKHPIAWAFGVAVVVTLGLLLFMPYTHQEAPWAIFFIGLTFPFTWFFAWLVTNGIAWWQDTMNPDAGDKTIE